MVPMDPASRCAKCCSIAQQQAAATLPRPTLSICDGRMCTEFCCVNTKPLVGLAASAWWGPGLCKDPHYTTLMVTNPLWACWVSLAGQDPGAGLLP
jgi:hypothetical protein